MIRYVDRGDNIEDRETGFFIPKNTGNRLYQDYLEWLTEGGVPIGAQPGPAYILVDDSWVKDPALETAINLSEAITNIKSRDIKLFEMLLAVWDVLKDKGLVTNTDLPADLRTEAAEWKTKLDLINAG